MLEIDRARAALSAIPPNLPRDEWHEAGRAAIAAGLTVNDIDEWSAAAENYSGRRDVLAAFRTIKPEGGTGAGTLFHLARQHGYSAPESAGPTQHINHPPKTPHRPAKQAAPVSPAEIWARCVPADPADSYINRKRGKPDGLRVYPADAAPLVIRGQNVGGFLAVPCWGAELQTLQFIPPAGGAKLNLPGASFNAGFFTVGEITDRAYIVEGIGQAWAVNQATGAAAAVSFGAHRMATVSKALKAKYPAARLIVVPDRGQEEPAAKIAADVGGEWVAMPADKAKNYDANDYAAEHGTEALRELLESAQAPEVDSPYPNICFDRITSGELERARLTPRTIVKNLFYADVRILNAAGGTGKTTIALYEAATMALGRTLWGRDVGAPRRTVLVTKEDSREILAARLREIINAMGVTPGDVEQVLEMVRIIDVSGERFRLSAVVGDVVEPHQANIDWMTGVLAPFRPDRLIFDPLVSFGVGESRVNDAEQGLIDAFRAFRNRLDCCVEGIHHIGKANAREKNLDQYSGRGGSALADGSRMVAVMQPLAPNEWQQQTGTRLQDGESGIVLALPKLSFSPPQAPIYILRNGYRFSAAEAASYSGEQVAKEKAEQVFNFIAHEYGQGRRYSNQDLENVKDKLNLTRTDIRGSLTTLKVAGRINYQEVRGKSGSHWEPVTLAGTNGDTQ